MNAVTPIRQCCEGKVYAEKCGHCRADAMIEAAEKLRQFQRAAPVFDDVIDMDWCRDERR